MLKVSTADFGAPCPQDLIQYPDRVNWYKAKFVADDAPDWNAGRFVRSRDAAPNLREIILEAEISREKVPLRNGYRHIGQRARVRVNGGSEIDLAGTNALTTASLQGWLLSLSSSPQALKQWSPDVSSMRIMLRLLMQSS